MTATQIMDGLQYIARLAQSDIAVSYDQETETFTVKRFIWYGAYGLHLVETETITREELENMFDTDMKYLAKYEREVK